VTIGGAAGGAAAALVIVDAAALRAAAPAIAEPALRHSEWRRKSRLFNGDTGTSSPKVLSSGKP
jgi:hypothetical protein